MKNRIFKIAAIVTAMAVACSLTACSENNENNENNNTQSTVNTAENTNGNEESKKPDESTAPEESKAPEESTAPDESKAPEESTSSDNGSNAGSDQTQPDNNNNEDNKTDSESKSDSTVKGENPNGSIQFSSNPVPLTTEAGKGEAIAKLAAEQAGIMYKFGGAAPDKGFDNSGLIYYALTENGISCPRLTCDIAQIGSKIKYDQLQIGDLAFFEYDDDGTAITYGGVYVGEGKMAISMSNGIPVKLVDITTNYYKSNFMWGICVAR